VKKTVFGQEETVGKETFFGEPAEKCGRIKFI
jgi:hypothetical protein